MKITPAAVIMLLLVSPPVLSEPTMNTSPVSGRSIAVACAGCHGTDGDLSKPGLPRLKAEPAERIYNALIEFKTGAKRSTIMGRIAKGYSDTELLAVAKYFESLSVEASTVENSTVERSTVESPTSEAKK